MSTVITPYHMAFVSIEDDNEFWVIITALIDFLLFIDMLINFLTGYYNSRGRLVKNKFNIFRRYLNGWFYSIFLQCFPFKVQEYLTKINKI